MRSATTTSQISVPFFDLSRLHNSLADQLQTGFDEIIAESAFIGGPAVEAFEKDWAGYCGVSHAVGVANGTDAIELVLRAMGVGPGDEVLVPANTFIASASAVIAAGAAPRFVDVDPGTLLIGADQVRAAVGPRTAAVLVVHLYGQPADVHAIEEVTKPLGIPIIEDAAQAHGAQLGGRMAGSLGLAGTFSFYPGKNLGALGDGGAVTTNDASLAERVRILANHGRAGGHHQHLAVGRNSRLDGMQAAFLRAKLPGLEGQNQARRRIVAECRSRLQNTRIDFVHHLPGAVSSNHLFVAQVDDRERFRSALGEAGIATSIHYPTPCHRHPAFDAHVPGYLPVVERAAERIVSLPLFPEMTQPEVDAVCEVIGEVMVGEERRR